MPRAKRSFTIKQKREALDLVEQIGIEEVARQLNIARGTIHGWTKQVSAIREFSGHASSKTLKGQGRKELFPGVPALITYMKDIRREEAVMCIILSQLRGY